MALSNIAQAYPSMTPKEVQQLAKENFLSIATTVAEILLIANDRFDINAHIVNKDEILATLKAATKDNTRGAVFLSMHFGNWELLAHFLAYNGYPSMGIGRRGNNSLIEERLTLPFRGRYGNINVYKNKAMIKLIKALKQNENIGLLIDQKAGYKNSIKTTFFGKECYTTSSIATIALRYKPLVASIFLKRIANGKYEIVMDILEFEEDTTKTQEQNMLYITQKCNDILEKTIKTAPEQWFWMHNRWKI